MNQQEASRWKNEAIDQVLAAFAGYAPLRDVLIFKGARILNLRLGVESRQSLDLDANLDFSFTTAHATLQEQRACIEEECKKSLPGYFGGQNPIRYQVQAVTVKLCPPSGQHPHGWTGLAVSINLLDHKRPGARGLPRIEIDVASPETLRPSSTSELPVGNHTIRAYTLERIAGEKLRAFLSSLPAYLHKIVRRSDSRRVKDLYDLARIRRSPVAADETFWRTVGEEFRLACESRYIDCAGLTTFAEGLSETASLYGADTTIPKDIPFPEAWMVIEKAVVLFERHGIIPFSFPLPPKAARAS